MALKRLIKTHKVTKLQALGRPRFEPYKPVVRDQHYLKDRAQLENFEAIHAEGLMFVPDEALPPWKRSVISNLKKNENQYNFRGLRVRVVDRQDEPGFPTHFR